MSHAPNMDTNTTDRSENPAAPCVGSGALFGDTPRSDAILLRAIDPTVRAYEFRLLSEQLERENARLRESNAALLKAIAEAPQRIADEMARRGFLPNVQSEPRGSKQSNT